MKLAFGSTNMEIKERINSAQDGARKCGSYANRNMTIPNNMLGFVEDTAQQMQDLTVAVKLLAQKQGVKFDKNA